MRNSFNSERIGNSEGIFRSWAGALLGLAVVASFSACATTTATTQSDPMQEKLAGLDGAVIKKRAVYLADVAEAAREQEAIEAAMRPDLSQGPDVIPATAPVSKRNRAAVN